MTHARSEPTSDPAGLPRELCDLADEIGDALRAWAARPEPWSEARFGELALAAFRLQHEHVAPYRRYCRRRGVEPDGVEGWRDVPPVPTAAFRVVDLVAGDPAAAPVVFRTSGTTRGAAHRGSHPVLFPGLYRASALAAFRHFVLGTAGFPADRRPSSAPEPPLPVLSLVPPHPQSDDSSLAWMVDAVVERFGAEPSVHAADGEGIRWEAADRWLRAVADGDRPVCVVATTLALDAWTRRLAQRRTDAALPPGSRVMDTGGAKGREGLERSDVLDRAAAVLDVPPSRVVNELGMTELLSQRYSSPEDGRLYGPPWLRTRALDPVSLEPLPDGQEGVLCHHDLANVGSVCAVLTEDRGSVVEGGVAWSGRTPGATPRGCSLATAELLAAQEATHDA